MEILARVCNKIELTVPQNVGGPEFLIRIFNDTEVMNPERIKAARYCKYLKNIPEKLYLWEHDEKAGLLLLPRGYAWRLMGLLHNIPYRFIDDRVQLQAVEFGSKIKLRDYQLPAVEAMIGTATQGILQAPAGSGKTQMGLEIIARIGQPALWLTHTKDLAEQVLTRAAGVLDIPRGEIGMLGAGRNSVGRRLTIGIVQKMVRMDLSEIAGRFGTVIIDEVHHSPASTWATVINQLPASWGRRPGE